MARNRDSDRRSDDNRERSSSKFNEMTRSVRSRPIAAAAVATAAAAAGAYFLSRRSGGSGDESKPLMNWGRKDRDQGMGSGRMQGSTTHDSMLETAGAAPSAAAGTSSTGSSPRKARGSSSGMTQPASGTSRSSDRSSDTGSQTSPASGNSGLDQTSKSQSKTGAISY